jgi:phage-related minor tail protein
MTDTTGIAELTKQVADLTKQVDDLKKAVGTMSHDFASAISLLCDAGEQMAEKIEDLKKRLPNNP